MISEKKRPSYPRVENLILAGNTCVDNKGPCVYLNESLGTRKRHYLPNNVLLMNNAFHESKGSSALISGQQNSTLKSVDNYVSGGSLGYADANGFIIGDLAVHNVVSDIIAPAEHYSRFSCDGLSDALQDMDWQDKDKAQALCEQLAKGNVANVSKPKFKDDVGPFWKVAAKFK